ncbi:adenylyl cyclase X E-like [Drosophila biarmipes]|uniref:adenylyl cyclase X E-like n=1 Tax=Drosophila biarmipes TaxID=125945 RepID=UPI0007E754DD|nr:adenylyl cyclase X E-like [Drosophila biarmipes]
MNKKKYQKTSFRERLKPCHLDYSEERKWEPNYLKARCEDLNLEDEYKKYQIRLMISYLTVFYPLYIIVVVVLQVVAWSCAEYTKLTHVDSILAAITLLLVTGIMGINFFESFVIGHRWVSVLTSVLSTYVVVFSDIAQITYHYHKAHWPLNTTYDVFVLCMVYMFLPIPSIVVAALLATSVSAIYIGYFIFFPAGEQESVARNIHGSYMISVDVFHYMGFNMMGIFFRIMNDIMVRASFLDRHQFIKEEMWLRHALRQESTLLDSILPPQIAKPIQEIIKSKISQSENGPDNFLLGSPRRRENFMAIQIHPDVSILYADVVNYTHLTTTLSVEMLVKVLHDLYGRFDMAASTFNVQRIKFLGDCYYCVAGLTEADPDHATMAVSLGISMIANLQEVRTEHSLDIDMRIGVHSGTLFAGVIGEAKLQFDIWGADVEIANRLEATGKPGYVHVSGRTLSSLNPADYKILPGTEKAQADPVLQKHPMSTYLLTGEVTRDSVRSVDIVSSYSDLDIRTIRPTRKTQIVSADAMSNELREEFNKMPVGGFQFRLPCCRRDATSSDEKDEQGVGTFCAAFKDSLLEWNYMHQPDFIFKSSMLLAWAIGGCLIFIQIVNSKVDCKECIVVDLIVFSLLTSLLCLAWYKKVCWWQYGYNEHKQYSKLSCLAFNLFDKIQHSFVLRVTIYMVIMVLYYMVISMILIKCDQNQYALDIIENKLFHYDVNRDSCFNPWVFTNMITLILGMSYTFARIPFALKICISCCETIAFLLIVFFQFAFIFHHSATTTPYMKAEVAHCLRVCVMFITMYAKERRVEFITKLNYKQNVDLHNKQKAADVTNQSIIILLNNILPSHVVDLYLDSLARHELYYENYEMVSVMFAMLVNFQMDLPSLRVLNDIITEFDKLLTAYREYYVVEKIKVVGCTYMAACGLDFSLTSNFQSRSFESEMQQVRIHQESKGIDLNHDEVAFIMTTFALDLMRIVSVCNKAYASRPFNRSLSTGEICIGISTGEIMAGVVGASQPHYDIWGNPVNMASRMESTGLPGHIHVTEESAEILKQFDILCIYRGMTYVKGRGEIPTYFVGIDENLKFMSSKFNNRASRRFTVMSSLDPDEFSINSVEENTSE